MADENTIFMLEDDDDMQGFDDVEVVEAEEEKPLEDEGEKAEEVKDEGEKEETPEPDEPEKKTQFDVDQFAAMIAKQTEQINTLLEVNKKLTEKATAQPEPQPEAPAKPQFTAQDWEDNPEACTDAMYDYRKQIEAFEQQTQEKQQQTVQKQSESELKAQHEADWAEEAQENPFLNDPRVRQTWSQIFYSGLHQKPDGVIRATRELKRQAKLNKVDLNQYVPGQKPDEPADPAEAARKGAEDEAARQRRVKQGTMHGGGKGGGQQKVSLTPAQIEVAKKMNITDMDLYAKTIQAMKGGK